MCGRFICTHSAEEIYDTFEAAPGPEFTPRYNIAPGQSVPIIRESEAGREVVGLTWGLVPRWATDGMPSARSGFINAKSETVAKKPSFRDAFRKRRCVVPADGFYEWETVGRKKEPFWFRFPDRRLFAFAGLWEPHSEGGKAGGGTFTILTTAANPDVSPYHERMPVILLPEQASRWLVPSKDPSADVDLLQPLPAESLVSSPVDPALNSPKSDHAGLLNPGKRQGKLF